MSTSPNTDTIAIAPRRLAFALTAGAMVCPVVRPSGLAERRPYPGQHRRLFRSGRPARKRHLECDDRPPEQLSGIPENPGLGKQSEQHNMELKAKTEELLDKNVELERQRLAVEEANRLKSQFLANMSHELGRKRRPLMNQSSSGSPRA